MRQVIQAAQSKKFHRLFCDTHGEPVGVPGGRPHQLFPSPEIVLALSAGHFRELGLAFKMCPLQAAAAAYLEQGARWGALEPVAVIGALQNGPRIGPWTAAAAVADRSNDWALYPYDDLAVRTWAKRAAPSYAWPATEPAFAALWRELGALSIGPDAVNSCLEEADMVILAEHAVAGTDSTHPLDALFVNAPLRDCSERPRVNDVTLLGKRCTGDLRRHPDHLRGGACGVLDPICVRLESCGATGSTAPRSS